MRIEWIKISVDIFNNRKIKRILKEPDGNLMVFAWFRLLVIAAELNDGGRIYFCEEKEYTPEALADDIGLDEDIVRRALELFKQYNMIGEDLTILNWEKYQNVDAFERYKQNNRNRQKKFQESKKGKNNVISENTNVSITLDNVTEEKRIDKKRKEEKRVDSIAEQALPIIAHLNEVAGTSYRSNSKETLKHISARLKDGFLQEEFFAVIDKKWREWGGTDMERYMRPQTLFGTKMESYLNAPDAPKQKPKKGGQPSNNVDWDSLV